MEAGREKQSKNKPPTQGNRKGEKYECLRVTTMARHSKVPVAHRVLKSSSANTSLKSQFVSPCAASGKLPGAVPQVRTKGNGHHGSGSFHLLCSVPTGGAASDGDLVAGHLIVLSGSCGLHPGVGVDPGPSSLGVMSLRCT